MEESSEMPLSTRELLRMLRDRYSAPTPAHALALLEESLEDRAGHIGEYRLVASLIDQFETEHGPL